VQGRKTNPGLERLAPLVGEWELEASVSGEPQGRARSTFEWLEDGAYLAIRGDGEPTENAPQEWVENSPLPTMMIVGLDDAGEIFYTLYADARAVSRVYLMTLSDRVWKMWRDAPGFHQRFSAELSQDGRTMTGAWEKSRDGSDWELDFDVVYTRTS
jgi:hypothetical protein